MTKSNKQIIIDFIISFLEKGVERGPILAKVGKKWGTSTSAFDRMLKIAKQQHAERRAAINKELAEVDKQAAVDARKKAIMTADERKVMLTKIAKGQIKLPYTEVKWNPSTKKFETIKFVELPNHNSRISAMAELNKMDGDYAPLKIANTNKAGEDVPPPAQIIVNPGQSLEIAEKE